MKKYLLSILFLFVTLFGYAQLEIPKTDSAFISHPGHSLIYSEKHEQPVWVGYKLTKAQLFNIVKRATNFKIDTLIKTETASYKDYKGSGYDRGHLAPARDLQYNDTVQKASFLYSNVSPQVASFNRGIWLRLENQVRRWAIQLDTTYVITGPIFIGDLKTIGENEVSVPDYFYKVILGYDGVYHAIGFVIPNKKSDLHISNYVVSIDFVEALTGLDFFNLLNDNVEEKIEAELSNHWF